MNSACQIRMFVNAPKAYANRKYQNRVGNSKRGRPKDSNVADPPSKTRKTNAKPVTRSRRTGSNLLTTSIPQARVQSQVIESPIQRPHRQFPTPPPYSMSPSINRMAHIAPMQEHPYVQQRLYHVSPPPRDSLQIYRVPTIPPQRHTQFMSPPALSHGPQSAPPSPEEAKMIYDQSTETSLSIQRYDGAFYPGDAPLFETPWSWSGGQAAQVCTGTSANLFAVRPEAADEALSHRQQADVPYTDTSNFADYWQCQQGVQQLPALRPEDIENTGPNTRHQ